MLGRGCMSREPSGGGCEAGLAQGGSCEGCCEGRSAGEARQGTGAPGLREGQPAVYPSGVGQSAGLSNASEGSDDSASSSAEGPSPEGSLGSLGSLAPRSSSLLAHWHAAGSGCAAPLPARLPADDDDCGVEIFFLKDGGDFSSQSESQSQSQSAWQSQSQSALRPQSLSQSQPALASQEAELLFWPQCPAPPSGPQMAYPPYFSGQVGALPTASLVPFGGPHSSYGAPQAFQTPYPAAMGPSPASPDSREQRLSMPVGPTEQGLGTRQGVEEWGGAGKGGTGQSRQSRLAKSVSDLHISASGLPEATSSFQGVPDGSGVDRARVDATGWLPANREDWTRQHDASPSHGEPLTKQGSLPRLTSQSSQPELLMRHLDAEGSPLQAQRPSVLKSRLGSSGSPGEPKAQWDTCSALPPLVALASSGVPPSGSKTRSHRRGMSFDGSAHPLMGKPPVPRSPCGSPLVTQGATPSPSRFGPKLSSRDRDVAAPLISTQGTPGASPSPFSARGAIGPLGLKEGGTASLRMLPFGASPPSQSPRDRAHSPQFLHDLAGSRGAVPGAKLRPAGKALGSITKSQSMSASEGNKLAASPLKASPKSILVSDKGLRRAQSLGLKVTFHKKVKVVYV